MTDYISDCIVYGATKGGQMAAARIASRGLNVDILEWSDTGVGGMTDGGLFGAMDYIREPTRWGLTKLFFERVTELWLAENPDWASETYSDTNSTYWDWDVARYLSLGRILARPEMARQATAEIIAAQPGEIRLRTGIWIDQVDHLREGVRITLTNGDTYTARNAWDYSYEADLLRMSGVSLRVGRDAAATYGEVQSAGRREGSAYKTSDILDAKGNLWPYIRQMQSSAAIGTADRLTMQYVFRMTISKHEDRLPFSQPSGYRRKDFEWFIELGQTYTGFENISSYKRINGHLFGTNGPNLPGLSWGYSETTSREARLAYWARVFYFQSGMYWTAANDTAMPAALRADMALHGLPHDDNQGVGNYYGTPGWSSQLYVREAATMVGDSVLTDANILSSTLAMSLPDPIGLHGYNMDSHAARHYATVEGGNEYDGHIPLVGEGFYQVGLQHVKAPKGQAPNVGAGWAFSQSRSALCSTRIEPPFTQLSEACGLVQAIAAERGVDTADVTYGMVRPELDALGAILTGFRRPNDDEEEIA